MKEDKRSRWGEVSRTKAICVNTSGGISPSISLAWGSALTATGRYNAAAATMNHAIPGVTASVLVPVRSKSQESLSSLSADKP